MATVKRQRKKGLLNSLVKFANKPSSSDTYSQLIAAIRERNDDKIRILAARYTKEEGGVGAGDDVEQSHGGAASAGTSTALSRRSYFAVVQLDEFRLQPVPESDEGVENELSTFEKVIVAIKENRAATVRELVASRPSVVSETTELERMTPLHFAIHCPTLEIAGFLIDSKASVQAKDYKYRTPLHYATEAGNIDIVRHLLSASASLNDTDERQLTPLQLACTKGIEPLTHLFIHKGAKPNTRNDLRETALHLAVSSRHMNVVQALIKLRADVNAKDIQQLSPLHIVARRGDQEIARVLIEHKAEINARNEDGLTPLHYAAAAGREGMVSLLISAVDGADAGNVHARDADGRSPAQLAATAAIRALLAEASRKRTYDPALDDFKVSTECEDRDDDADLQLERQQKKQEMLERQRLKEQREKEQRERERQLKEAEQAKREAAIEAAAQKIKALAQQPTAPPSTADTSKSKKGGGGSSGGGGFLQRFAKRTTSASKTPLPSVAISAPKPTLDTTIRIASTFDRASATGSGSASDMSGIIERHSSGEEASDLTSSAPTSSSTSPSNSTNPSPRSGARRSTCSAGNTAVPQDVKQLAKLGRPLPELAKYVNRSPEQAMLDTLGDSRFQLPARAPDQPASAPNSEPSSPRRRSGGPQPPVTVTVTANSASPSTPKAAGVSPSARATLSPATGSASPKKSPTTIRRPRSAQPGEFTAAAVVALNELPAPSASLAPPAGGTKRTGRSRTRELPLDAEAELSEVALEKNLAFRQSLVQLAEAHAVSSLKAKFEQAK